MPTASAAFANFIVPPDAYVERNAEILLHVVPDTTVTKIESDEIRVDHPVIARARARLFDPASPLKVSLIA